MIYLLDANTLIDAKRDYFQFERVPEFWEWIAHQGEIGHIKIPLEIYSEFEEPRKSDGSRDALSDWAADQKNKDWLILPEEPDTSLVNTVVTRGYCATPSDQELESIGNDPFLIAAALKDPLDRVVVTTEVSKPSRKGANRKIPDVCNDFHVRAINSFELLSELNFTTNWKNR